jgi:hypothetical protein
VSGPKCRPGRGISSRFALFLIDRFYHCGSSGADIASFDPRSGLRNVAMGDLFYLLAFKLVSSLSFPHFDPRSRWRVGVKPAGCYATASDEFRLLDQ